MSAGVGIKVLRRKDTGAYQIISVVAGGPAKASGMVQENDTLVKVRPAAVPPVSVSVCLCLCLCLCLWPCFWRWLAFPSLHFCLCLCTCVLIL
jgi:hypothetical protein